MSEDDNIAAAMLRLHGRKAAEASQEYAARYRKLGDEAQHRKWTKIGRLVRKKIEAAAPRGNGQSDPGPV